MNKEMVEFWENEYLNQIEYLLKVEYQKMMAGFSTKEYIKDDWIRFLGSQTSDFAVGAERIFYWIFNQFGVPNSSPIGSDLFFETYNAYVHIDVKTVTLANIGDYQSTIFVGNNQVSYEADIVKQNGNDEHYTPHLPNFYTKRFDGKVESKVCLTYFITILYDENNLDIYNLSVMCVPNGSLYDVYKDDVYSAGKNPGKARFKFSNCLEFRLLNNCKRIRIIEHKSELSESYNGMTQNKYSKSMQFWNDIYNDNI